MMRQVYVAVWAGCLTVALGTRGIIRPDRLARWAVQGINRLRMA